MEAKLSFDINDETGSEITESNVLAENAIANVSRRKIIEHLSSNGSDLEDLLGLTSRRALNYHIRILEKSGLVTISGVRVMLSQFGESFLHHRSHPCSQDDFASQKPIEITEVRQLLPCIAEPCSSKFRMIAHFSPQLDGALRHMEPLFPRSTYSEQLGALVVPRGNALITIYSAGRMALTRVSSEGEAREVFEEIKGIINSALAKGAYVKPRRKPDMDLMEINGYLPQLNCRECGELGCYSFALKLLNAEAELDKCLPLREARYAEDRNKLKILENNL